MTAPPPQQQQQQQQYPTLATQDDKKKKKREILLSKLPPIHTQTDSEDQFSKIQIEFRKLLEELLFTDDEIRCAIDPRLRAVLEGIIASYYEPAVYRAFEVLYEDYMPLRVAGRVAHKRLKQGMDRSIERRKKEVQEVMERINMDETIVTDTWMAMKRLGTDDDGDIRDHVIKVATDAFELSMEDVAARLFPDSDINFQNLMERLNQCKTDVNMSDARFEALLVDLQKCSEQNQQHSVLLNPKYNDRYNGMLQQFSEWKDLVPTGESRRLDIVRGCFVGAENLKVVEALRVIYCDNSALRMSGNWIFKLVSAFMNSRAGTAR